MFEIMKELFCLILKTPSPRQRRQTSLIQKRWRFNFVSRGEIRSNNLGYKYIMFWTEDCESQRKRAKVLQVSQEREEHEERFSTATVKSFFYLFTVLSPPWILWFLFLFSYPLCFRILMLRLRCSLDNICVIHNFLQY